MNTVENKMRIKLTVVVDDQAENPIDDTDFELITFDRHTNFRDKQPEWLVEAEEKKSFWWVSKFEHGNSVWFLQGSSDGVYCKWDTTHTAGVLHFKGDSTHYSNLQECAERAMRDYTKWANGENYYCCIEEETETRCPCPTCGSGIEISVKDFEHSGDRDVWVTGDSEIVEQIVSGLHGLSPDVYSVQLIESSDCVEHMNPALKAKLETLGYDVEVL